MRLLFPVAIVIAAGASGKPAMITPPSEHRPNLSQASDCPNPSSQFARNGSVWREKPARPQKLAELPPAEAYATVYRLDERGCMVPVKYRDIRR
jgi:hypothetical protein